MVIMWAAQPGFLLKAAWDHQQTPVTVRQPGHRLDQGCFHADALTSGITVELRRNWIYGNLFMRIENGNGFTIDATRNQSDKAAPITPPTPAAGQRCQRQRGLTPGIKMLTSLRFPTSTVTNLDQGNTRSTIQAVSEANLEIPSRYPGTQQRKCPHRQWKRHPSSATPAIRNYRSGACNAPVIDCAGLEMHGGHAVQGGFYIHGTNAHDVVIEGFEIKNVTARTDGSGVFGQAGEGVSNVTPR